jgi:hypothetical protein
MLLMRAIFNGDDGPGVKITAAAILFGRWTAGRT